MSRAWAFAFISSISFCVVLSSSCALLMISSCTGWIVAVPSLLITICFSRLRCSGVMWVFGGKSSSSSDCLGVDGVIESWGKSVATGSGALAKSGHLDKRSEGIILVPGLWIKSKLYWSSIFCHRICLGVSRLNTRKWVRFLWSVQVVIGCGL